MAGILSRLDNCSGSQRREPPPKRALFVIWHPPTGALMGNCHRAMRLIPMAPATCRSQYRFTGGWCTQAEVVMIKLLDGFPENVVACSGEGHVTRKDYEEVLIPRVNAVLSRYDKVRLYYEFGPAFHGIDAGAAWEDFKVGVENLSRWERMAVVTDVAWIRLALSAFRVFMPRQLRLFAANQSSHARAWIQTD